MTHIVCRGATLRGLLRESLAASGVKQVLVSDLNKDGILDVAAFRGDANTGSLVVLAKALAPGSIRLTVVGSGQQVFHKDFGITLPPRRSLATTTATARCS